MLRLFINAKSATSLRILPMDSRSALQLWGGGCNRHGRFGGYTLTEVLIVIGIIGSLTALMFPIARGAAESRRGVQCVAKLRQIGVVIGLYLSEHNNVFPPANAATTLPPNAVTTLAEAAGWSGAWYAPTLPVDGGLVPYVQTREALDSLVVCPGNRYVTSGPPPTKNQIGYPYTVNYNVMVASGAVKAKSKLEIERPSEIVLMADSALGTTGTTTWGTGVNSTTSGWAALDNRHGGRMNILWVDGHVTTGRKDDDIKNVNLRGF